MAERDKHGRFVKGHKPINTHNNPGRPKRNTEEKYLKWMVARVRKADWDVITDTAIARAKSGDNVARQWLSDYLVGKPSQQVQLDVVSDLNIVLTWPEDEDIDDSPAEVA